MRPPVLQLGSPTEALALSGLRHLDGAPLLDFVRAQRWFAAKDTAPADARFVAVVPMFPSVDAAFTLVEVRAADGAVATYALPLALSTVAERPQLATVAGGAGPLFLVDAVHDASFRAALFKLVLDGRELGGHGARLSFTTYSDAGLTPLEGHVLGGEQSNSSIAYGEELVIKVLRRLTPGPNPEVELGAYLTGLGFAGTPALAGSAVLAHGGQDYAVVVAHRMIPEAVDLWSYVGEHLHTYFAESPDHPLMPFVDDAEQLGRLTRDLHEALAQFPGSPARPLGRDAVLELAARLEQELRALEDTEAHREPLLRELAGLRAVGDAGRAIRHHGDLHLGQVLRGADASLYIIDFEGEPARSLAERRALASPLRDVAGVYRSFEYAAATCAARTPECARSARRWCGAVRSAFFSGYVLENRDSLILPPDPLDLQRLLRAFELEKLLYELRYELGSRPDWVWIPRQGIAQHASRA